MKVLTPIKAIRAYCIECSGGMTKEIKLCTVEKCPLYPYRMGNQFIEMLFKIIIREGCEYRRIVIQYVYKACK
ncbi:hypothetical protein BHK98_05695 [Hornefia porci]|uniref:Uncharacterized protein n=1 Tax=Hornefia porci TaxID=2652292 RepID=A0A1Q9JHJ6_9FIRM|nr:hypothetical protein BHK98_05695 [Hornefia porci]